MDAVDAQNTQINLRDHPAGEPPYQLTDSRSKCSSDQLD